MPSKNRVAKTTLFDVTEDNLELKSGSLGS